MFLLVHSVIMFRCRCIGDNEKNKEIFCRQGNDLEGSGSKILAG